MKQFSQCKGETHVHLSEQNELEELQMGQFECSMIIKTLIHVPPFRKTKSARCRRLERRIEPRIAGRGRRSLHGKYEAFDTFTQPAQLVFNFSVTL